MKLYLDTSNNKKTIVRLDEAEFIKEYDSPRDQDVLGAMVEALAKVGATVQDVSEIKVNTGPGSFTGLRVGIAIANALSFALNLPINGNEPGAVIVPDYGKKPNISTPKSR